MILRIPVARVPTRMQRVFVVYKLCKKCFRWNIYVRGKRVRVPQSKLIGRYALDVSRCSFHVNRYDLFCQRSSYTQQWKNIKWCFSKMISDILYSLQRYQPARIIIPLTYCLSSFLHHIIFITYIHSMNIVFITKQQNCTERSKIIQITSLCLTMICVHNILVMLI